MSRMDISAKVANPNDIRISMTIEMPLSDWVTLKGQMDSPGFPSCDIRDKIRELVRQAEKVYCPTEEEPCGEPS